MEPTVEHSLILGGTSIFVWLAIFPLSIAAIQDARFRIIPDTCVATVAICGVLLHIMQGWQSLGIALVASSAVLVAMVALFNFRLVGGGDAKLIPATCLMFPAAQVLSFLLFTAIAGGLLSLLMLLGGFMRSKFKSRGPRLIVADHDDTISEFGFEGPGLPYGIAILGGFLAAWGISA